MVVFSTNHVRKNLDKVSEDLIRNCLVGLFFQPFNVA